MSEKREEAGYFARLCEQAERYDEMSEHMNVIVTESEDALTIEERNLLSVAYKNVVGARRAAWRIVSSVEQKEQNKGNTANHERAKNLRLKIEQELNDVCNQILKLVDDHLLKKFTNDEPAVFYLKMTGDYYRYISEFSVDEAKSNAATSAQEAYQQATTMAAEILPPTNPVRLGLALNHSVFFYEILSNPDEARRIAKEAFEDAMAQLDREESSKDAFKDSTLIMQLLRDNLTLWNSDAGEQS
eukprot:Platyproteum_vivax@DN5861_c0_g1_i1.p1